MHILRVMTLCGLLAFGSQAFAQSCAAPGPVSETGRKLARIAEDEYTRFNGHRIDAQGRLWKFGNDEVETEPLLNPQTGETEPREADRFAWRRVWRYWEVLDTHVPGTLSNRRVVWAPDLLEDPANSGRQHYTPLIDALAEVPAGPDGKRNELLSEALVRAALSDVPWSAAFISYVMSEGGLTAEQFNFSSAHASYIRPALEDAPGYAYRACDPRTTRPRVGDLICYSRGADLLQGFQDWRAHVAELGNRSKSHCDIVISTDYSAAKMESIGGNVEQAVTRRRLMLKADGTLSDKHQLALHPTPKAGGDCARDISCHKENLNLQAWGILLQLK